MSIRKTPIAAALGLLLLSGCSRGGQKVGSGASDGGSAGNGITLVVSYQGQSIPVDLGSVATTRYEGRNLVKLSDVWSASRINTERSNLQFEFVGDDGFKPSEKGCADPSGGALEKGYIDPSSRNLMWDGSFSSKGCYSVKNVAKMNAHTSTDGSNARPKDSASKP